MHREREDWRTLSENQNRSKNQKASLSSGRVTIECTFLSLVCFRHFFLFFFFLHGKSWNHFYLFIYIYIYFGCCFTCIIYVRWGIHIALCAFQNYNFTAFELFESSPTLEDKIGCRCLQAYTVTPNSTMVFCQKCERRSNIIGTVIKQMLLPFLIQQKFFNFLIIINTFILN